MILSFHPCFDTDIQILLRYRPPGTRDLKYIRDAEAIILPQTCSKALYEMCRQYGSRIFPNYDMRFKYPGKTGQHLLFEQINCPHPETFIWSSIDAFRNAFREANHSPHAWPFFLKNDTGHESRGTFLVKDENTLADALDQLSSRKSHKENGFISQSMIPSEGNVLRVVIIGKKTIAYWKRPRKPGDSITSISQGDLIDEHWRPDLQEKGENRARILSTQTGINVAAFDFVFDFSLPNPEPLCLEINYYFARRGLGGSVKYYHLLFEAIKDWIKQEGLDPKSIRLV